MSRIRRCAIIAGISGAGRRAALRVLEDRGFFAVDNIPPVLLGRLAETLGEDESASCAGLAAIVDVHTENFMRSLGPSLESLREKGVEVVTIFLDASDDALIRNYETTRRRHPWGRGITTVEAISRERAALARLKEGFEVILDTSELQPGELRGLLLSKLGVSDDPFMVVVSSFGFKNGIPRDCDYLFDVRFLPNPNYVPELKKLSGRDAEVRNYLDKIPEKRELMERLEQIVEFILAHYGKTGKRQLHIAIGCTGGRHRSVAVAEELSMRLSDAGYRVSAVHRDVELEGE